MKTDFVLSLAAVRVNMKMTQAELAKAIGVDKGTIFNWENEKGEPTASALRKISDLSGIPMDYIFVPCKSDKIGMTNEDK